MGKSVNMKRIFIALGIYVLGIRIIHSITLNLDELYKGGDSLYHIVFDTILMNELLVSLLLSLMASIIFFYVYEYSKYINSGYDSLLEQLSFLEIRMDSLIYLIDPVFLMDNINEYDFNYVEIKEKFMQKIKVIEITEDFYIAYINICIKDLKKHEVFDIGNHSFYWIKQKYNLIMKIMRLYSMRINEYKLENNEENDFENLLSRIDTFDEITQKSIIYFYNHPEKRTFSRNEVRKALTDEFENVIDLIVDIEVIIKSPIKFILEI